MFSLVRDQLNLRKRWEKINNYMSLNRALKRSAKTRNSILSILLQFSHWRPKASDKPTMRVHALL